MSAASAALVRSWAVGSRYRVTMTIQRPVPGEPVAAVVEWVPAAPAALTTQELREYRLGRDAAIAEAAHSLGVTAVVVET